MAAVGSRDEALIDAKSVTGRLNQAARRLRHFESERQWSRTLVESARDFCGRCALFAIHGPDLDLLAAWNLDGHLHGPAPLAAAAAFLCAVETRDPVVAVRTRGELSEPIARLMGESAGRRFYLFPLSVRDRIAAILYADADSGAVDANALELLATLAAGVLERRQPAGLLGIRESKT